MKDTKAKRHSSKGTKTTQELFIRGGRLGNCATFKKALQQASLDTKAPRHKETETQGNRNTETKTETQRPKDPTTQRPRDPEAQRHTNTRTKPKKTHRDTETQQHRDTKTKKHRDPKTQRHPDPHKHRETHKDTEAHNQPPNTQTKTNNGKQPHHHTNNPLPSPPVFVWSPGASPKPRTAKAQAVKQNEQSTLGVIASVCAPPAHWSRAATRTNTDLASPTPMVTEAQKRNTKAQGHKGTDAPKHTDKPTQSQSQQRPNHRNKQTNKHTNARHKQSERQKVGQQTIHHPGLSTCEQINANHPKRDYPSPR